MKNKILISFAAGDKWYRSQALLCDSAKKYKMDGCINYTDKNKDWDFVTKYNNIFTDTRGYGFWQWKPLIIQDALSQVDYGDFVLYVDSGNCIINNLDYIFTACDQHEIVLFENRDGNYQQEVHKNIQWTKRDCFVMMDCDDEKYYNAPQVDASYQVYKKTDKVMEFVEEYKKFCSNENIISDLPNITKSNLQGFIDHRHDQSVLSLLAAKHNIPLLPEPSEWGNYLTDRPYPQLFWHHRGVF
jgi:hypothetical protein